MSVESQVESARRAVVGTGQHAVQLASDLVGSASDLVGQGVEIVEADVVAPLGKGARRLKDRVAPPPRRRRPPLLGLALLALVAVVVGAVLLRRRRFARLEVDRAGAVVAEPPPDAFGAAVVATSTT